MEILIIGNGVTGVSAALKIRELQPEWDVTVISGESTYHYSRPSLMYIFMGHMSYQNTKPYDDDFWSKKRINLLRDWVTGIDVGTKSLVLHKNGRKHYDRLLIATGSKPNMFGWPGQDLEGVQGLYDLPDLRKLYKNTTGVGDAVVVGGGLIGVELAEMLHSRNIKVTVIEREEHFWGAVLPPEEASMVERVIKRNGIDLRLGTELREIVGDQNGRACAVVTDSGEKIPCGIVGLTAGVSPNTDLVRETEIKTSRGILVDSSFHTSVDDIYAAGDCAEIVTGEGGKNLIQQVWYTGKKQGTTAGEVIAGLNSSYDPGIWYNSAKFFDLEYQTYGTVKTGVPGEQHLYWEHPDGLRSIRIVFNEKQVTGINVMGMRYRHKVCEKWIQDKRPIEFVLSHLSEANFDPEFHDKFENEISHVFREKIS